MKAKYLFIGIALASILCACNRDEESLFELSAAERLEKALTDAKDILVYPENGWEMLYFANPESGGYSVILKFDEHGNVMVASRNPKTTGNSYKTDNNSTWTIRADYGPILSFDTYNDIIHKWADPDPYPDSKNKDYTPGDGYLGDYEFLILEASTERIRLKGKKHSSYCILYPMDKNLDWQEYFNQVYAYRDLIVTGNEGAAFNYISPGYDRSLEYNENRMDEDYENDIIYPFVIRPNGIAFHGNGIPAKGGNAVNFKMNADMTALVCTDNGVSAQIESAYTTKEYFDLHLDKNNIWQISSTDNGSAAQEAYNAFNKGLKNSGATLNFLGYTKMADGSIALQIRFTVSGKRYDGTISLTTNETTENLSIAYASADDYASAALKRAGGNNETKGIQLLNDLIAGTFSFSSASGSALNIQQMYMVDVNNPEHKVKIFVK